MKAEIGIKGMQMCVESEIKCTTKSTSVRSLDKKKDNEGKRMRNFLFVC